MTQRGSPARPPADEASASRPLRILLMSASYPPVLGGLQTVVHAIARQFQLQGHDVRVLANLYPRGLVQAETLDGVRVQRWPFLRPSLRQLRQARVDLFAAALYYYPRVMGRLRRLMREFRPDVVNVHFPDGQIPFALALRREFAFRLVVSLHGHEVMRFTSMNADRAARESADLRAVLRAADAVTACSPHLLDEASRLEPSIRAKGQALTNGIDPERFGVRESYPHPRPYLFAMGRLTRKKGFDLLLDALARTDPALDLILAGSGEEAPALREQARRLGLEQRVFFHGTATPEDVVRLLNGCRLLVVPSRVEPFGIVALEGLAAGRPVVATRVGGMGAFLDQLPASAATRLVEPNVEDLAAGISQALATPDIPGREMQQLIFAEHSWTAVAQRYLQTFRPAPTRPMAAGAAV